MSVLNQKTLGAYIDMKALESELDKETLRVYITKIFDNELNQNLAGEFAYEAAVATDAYALPKLLHYHAMRKRKEIIK